MIIYLSGAVRRDMVKLHPNLGFMHTPVMGNPRIPGTICGADTGLYGKPKDWTLTGYLRWVEHNQAILPPPMFFTAPDVVGDAEATWYASVPVLPQLRALGVKTAFVAQDGIDEIWDHTPWELFDCLFIGGSTDFKLGPVAYRVTQEALRRGKTVHMGRVNSYARLAIAYSWGCHSADGTFAAFGPYENAPQIVGWLARLEAEERMRAAA